MKIKRGMLDVEYICAYPSSFRPSGNFGKEHAMQGLFKEEADAFKDESAEVSSASMLAIPVGCVAVTILSWLALSIVVNIILAILRIETRLTALLWIPAAVIGLIVAGLLTRMETATVGKYFVPVCYLLSAALLAVIVYIVVLMMM